MVCIECGSESSVKLSVTELLECDHCGHKNPMEYYICFNCGTVWRQYNGDVYGSVSCCGNSRRHKNQCSSENYDTECIICQSAAEEISDGYFKCSNPICGFEWEVLNSG